MVRSIVQRCRPRRWLFVHVGSRGADGQGQTVPLGDQVDPRAVLAGPQDSGLSVPPSQACMCTASIAQRDQSSSLREPSSPRTKRWSFAHTLAFDHSAKRRWAVAPDGPNNADGSCCHVQPDVVTNTIAASPPGHRAGVGRRPEAATEPPELPAGTAPTTHPAPAAQRSKPRPAAYRPK